MLKSPNPKIADSAMRLILASASPRRAELLRAAGIEFDVHPAHVDERELGDESPDAYVRRVAEAKARAIGARFARGVVLAADTTVVADRHLLGKPIDVEDARRMLHLLSGRTQEATLQPGASQQIAFTMDAGFPYQGRWPVWIASVSSSNGFVPIYEGDGADTRYLGVRVKPTLVE